MRRLTIVLAASAVLAVSGVFVLRGTAQQAPAEAPKEKRTISTMGSATLRVKPDSARLDFSITTTAKTVKVARDDNALKMKFVSEAIANLKILNLRTYTSDIRVDVVESRNDQDPLHVPQTLGFRVVHSFTVQLRESDVDKLGAAASRVFDTCLVNGVTGVSGIRLERENEADLRLQVRTKAVENALVNAKALADGAKVTILETIAVDDRVPQGGAGGGSPNTELAVGEYEIGSEVNIVVRY